MLSCKKTAKIYNITRGHITLQTDIQEEEIFSTTLRMMLAATTRYAVGLVYQGGNDPEREQEALKEMLMQRSFAEKKEADERA